MILIHIMGFSPQSIEIFMKCWFSSSKPDNKMTKIFSQPNFIIIETILLFMFCQLLPLQPLGQKKVLILGKIAILVSSGVWWFFYFSFFLFSSGNIVYFVLIRKLITLGKKASFKRSFFCFSVSFILKLTPWLAETRVWGRVGLCWLV